MLKGALFPDNYAAWLDRIELPETKSAFIHLVGLAACCRSLTCHAQLKGEHGPIHDFRFRDQQGQQPFSFIVNKQKPLLFYFRSPATRHSQYSFEEVQRLFPDAKNPQAEEWTVPIATVADAQRLWEYLKIE